MSPRTAKEILASKNPYNTTIQIRSRNGLQLLAYCRKNKIAISSMADMLFDIHADDIIGSGGKFVRLTAKNFLMPKQGLR
jgi:hypothetical protein